MSEGPRNRLTADELREAFDAAFARPMYGRQDDTVALLAVRIGGDPMALRVLETAGLMQARAIVPVPSRRAELLGVSGIRGAVLPIYSLARLLSRAEEGEPRWIVLAGTGGERVGLAVAELERHVVAPARDLRPAAHAGSGEAHVPEVLHSQGQTRPVLSIPSILRAITGR